jgi:hypothetical protein
VQLTAADLGFLDRSAAQCAGRLDDMSIGIRCLLSDSESEALALATRLDQLNSERREIEAKMQDAALRGNRALRDPVARCATGVPVRSGWHQGVVGLVASRIKDRVRRPVIAFARAGTDNCAARRVRCRASTSATCSTYRRAPSGTHQPLRWARHGGGAVARGSAPRCVRARLRCGSGRWRDPSIPSNRVETDGELANDEIALETAQALRDGGPWGQAFRSRVSTACSRQEARAWSGDKHLKMWVTTADRRAISTHRFNFKGVERSRALPDGDVRLVYRLDINEYKGERRLQLLVDHVLNERIREAKLHHPRRRSARPGVRALIAELDAFNSALYPAESNHFDPPEALAGAGCVSWWSSRRARLVGCGAAKNCGAGPSSSACTSSPRRAAAASRWPCWCKLLDWARARSCRWRAGDRQCQRGCAQAVPARGIQGESRVSALQAGPLSIFMERPLR